MANIDSSREPVVLVSQVLVNSVRYPGWPPNGLPNSESSGIVPSTVGRSERVPQAINGICPVTGKFAHFRLAGPGITASMFPTVETKLLLRFGSMPVAVPSITTNPDPVGPEWPHTEPGMTAGGKAG